VAQENAAANQAQTATTTEHARPAGGVLDQIIDNTKAATIEESRPLVQKGVRELLRQVLKLNAQAEKDNKPEEKLRVDRIAVDRAIAELDKKLGQQIDKIIHNKQFKQMESSWRGLKFMVERTDFRQNIKVSLLNVSKEALLEDFKDSAELFQAGMYAHVHKAEYGQFGGKPYGAIIANYDFGPSEPDIELLRFCGGVAAMAHAPFIAAAGSEFFGLNSFEGLPRIKDVRGMFESKQYISWRSLRDSEDARYIGLTAPRFLLRRPYGPDNPVRAFNYQEESTTHDHFTWGNTAFAFATRLTESFAKYRWCPNIIGPQGGGTVEQLPVHLYKSDGDLVQKIPTEVLIPKCWSTSFRKRASLR
jgi:type VI secretion system protein ImpC